MAMVRVKLSDVVDGLEQQDAEYCIVLHKKTGRFVPIMDDDILAAEEDIPPDDGPAWQKDAVAEARDFLEHEEDYVRLPTEFDIHEYSIMERFILSLPDEGVSDALYRAIKGGGAFRRFKDEIHRLGVEDQWYKYRDEALRAIAVEWCEENNIEYNDE